MHSACFTTLGGLLRNAAGRSLRPAQRIFVIFASASGRLANDHFHAPVDRVPDVVGSVHLKFPFAAAHCAHLCSGKALVHQQIEDFVGPLFRERVIVGIVANRVSVARDLNIGAGPLRNFGAYLVEDRKGLSDHVGRSLVKIQVKTLRRWR